PLNLEPATQQRDLDPVIPLRRPDADTDHVQRTVLRHGAPPALVFSKSRGRFLLRAAGTRTPAGQLCRRNSWKGRMPMRITYLGHSAFLVEGGGVRLIIDPFLTNNPKAAARAEDIKVDYVIVTHAHDDHQGDAIPIARANDATVITTNEIAVWLGEQGVRAHGMHLGGKTRLGDGYARVFQAFHG